MPFRMGLSFVSSATKQKMIYNANNAKVSELQPKTNLQSMNFSSLSSANKKGCKSCGH